uniref:Uncharacterized protein n=1 Tax=Anguilla anguilla TaxID=7936 RepID=A0A0E9T6A3_ANGAN
MGKRERDGRL